jgi:hypothetical protein
MLFSHRKLRLTTSGLWNYGLSLNNTLSLPNGLERALLDKQSHL